MGDNAADPKRLPALDLSDEELLGLRPGRVMGTPRPPPPPANGPPSPDELHRRQGPDLQLDITGDTFLTSRYRPPVHGVLWGERPDAEPSDQDRVMAAKIANYGAVPVEPWRWGLYSWRVFNRRLILKQELSTLRQLALVSHAAYEKSVMNLAETARQILVRSGKAPPGDQVERIQLAFRVLEDVRIWGPEVEPGQRDVDGLQAIYQKRLHAAELQELALASVDERAFKLGIVLTIGGSVLFLLVLFSPVIYRSIYPPVLPVYQESAP